MSRVKVIINFSKVARTSFNVLVGALEKYVDDLVLDIVIARKKQALKDAILAIDADQTALILWSFYSPGFDKARQELHKLKTDVEHGSNILHLAGGVHASAEPQQTLEAGFDLVAVGEGEKIIVDLVNKLLEGEAPKAIKGLAYLEEGKLKKHGRGELIDLNDYPPYAPKHGMFGAMEITRGCIYACKFCQTPYVSKAKFRHRSIDNIAYYLKIMRAHEFRDYRFISPTSLSYGSYDDQVNFDALEDLLAAMREAIGPDSRLFYGTFPTEVRPEHVTIKALRILKKYVDNDNLIIGGQSGSQKILDATKRGHDVDSVIEAVKLCVEEGFLPNVDFLFGLPGEDKDDVKQTVKLAETLTDLGAKVHNHTFMPLPGTPLRKADAGKVDTGVQKIIWKLESEGKAYGKWKSQIQTAQALAAIREEKNVSK